MPTSRRKPADRPRKRKSGTPRDPVTLYAKDVVEGRIIAGEFAIGAARRHLNDLEKGAARRLVWDEESAIRAINFFPAILTVTAGAAEGQPFNLLPWHVFVVGSLFGSGLAGGCVSGVRGWRQGKGRRKVR